MLLNNNGSRNGCSHDGVLGGIANENNGDDSNDQCASDDRRASNDDCANNNEASRQQQRQQQQQQQQSQESFTQQLLSMTQTNNELTQLGGDDDMYCDGDDDDNNLRGSQSCLSPMAPIDPLTLPWGRLMPVGGGGGGSGPLGDDNNDMAAAGGNNKDNDNDNNNELPSSRPSSAASSSSVIQRHATEMLPRSPTSPVTTRSRSPSTGGTGGGSENTISSRGRSTSPSTMRIQFLGLRNLIPGDKFNEYVIGRSLKADVTAQKLVENNNYVGNSSAATTLAATTTTVADDEEQIQQQQQQLRRREDAKLKRNDYVHAMVSNRHCRIYCLLENINTHNDTNNNNSNANNDDGQSSSQTSILSSSFAPPPPDMEVFVEDTSGNGTLINGTTLLRKYERRRLHTGDVICLLNPKLLSKKIRSITERKAYMSQYSFVFVNLYEQEARHGWGITTSTTSTTNNTAEKIMTRGRMKTRSGGDSSIASPTPPLSSSTTKKMGTAAVNVRATKCHSIKNNNNSDKGGGDGTAKKYTAAATTATSSGATSSLGSFLNNQKSKYNPTDNNSNAHHPRGSVLSTHRTTTTTTTTTVRERRIEEDYDLRDLLGTGTCGEVRRAIHRRTGDERAVKIIAITGRKNGKNATNNNNLMSCDNLTAIQAEAEILRSLDHPYIVKLFDTYISHAKGTIYLVMELIRGGDLFDRIVDKRDGRYTEIQARRLFRRILTAVHYLHEDCDIVHRDLKPENILVVDRRSDVNIKLTDFGLAKNMTAEGLKTFCGTPQYFAPEVFRRSHTVKGNGRYGKEIDCWSIGVILFILLSGSPPFDVSAGFDSVANAEIVFYDDQWRLVTLEARDLLMRLLEKDPRKRLSVKDACDHAWVLMDDGDTHCHPLHDPLVVSLTTTRIKSEDASSTLADKATATATANISDKSVTKSTRVDENERQASIWPTSGQSHGDTETITNVIQESLQTLSQQLSPTASPIGKRQLFVTTSGAPKKMTKKDLETIKSAGNTLPTPVINNESRPTKKIPALAPTMKKKEKKQSTLFPSTGVRGVTQQQQQQQNKIAPNASSQLPDIENQNNKRKLRTSTVTPPGGGTEQQNCGLVFRLKHGGKYISPEARQTAASSTTTIADESKKKAELSEDELGDFSDDDGDIDNSFTAIAAPAASWETKKPLEKYLHKKRRIDSIESTASDSIKSISQLSSTVEIEPTEANSPTTSGSTTQEEKKQCTVPNNNNNTSKNKDRKFKQTFLFGRTPLNHDTSEELINLPELADVVNSTLNNDQPSESGESGGEIIRQCQSVTESKENGVTVNTTTNATLKGKQRSITSWFQPR